MIGSRLQRQIKAPFERRINRAPSPFIAVAVPWLAIMLGSLGPTLPIIAAAPVLPPLGFLFLIAWRQIRPGVLPVWAGFPLGMFDDLFSGQPFGSAMLLWSLAMLALEAVEYRFPWRNIVLDWAAASALIAAYLVLALALANAAGGDASLLVILPQIALSILLFPMCGRLMALFDRVRLVPFREVA